MTQLWHLPPDRYFDPVPEVRKLALDIYEGISGLPLVCPHGHVDPALFAVQNADFGTPPELLVCPDHYVLRMLYSQGVSLASLGIETRQGSVLERDSRRIWQTFADHFYLFRGTPTGMWLSHELKFILGIEEVLQGSNAQSVYDQINEKLGQPDFRPRALFEKFNMFSRKVFD